MKYSLEKISTVEMCNTLLAAAQQKKLHLERRRRNLGESIARFAERVDKIITELASVQLLLSSFATAYHALPEGSKYKLSLNIQIKRLELRQAQLGKRAMTCNAPLLLAKQVKYNRLGSQVSALERCITAVQTKRTALYNIVLRVIHAERKPVTSPSFRQVQRQPRTRQAAGRQWPKNRQTDGLHLTNHSIHNSIPKDPVVRPAEQVVVST